MRKVGHFLVHGLFLDCGHLAALREIGLLPTSLVSLWRPQCSAVGVAARSAVAECDLAAPRV